MNTIYYGEFEPHPTLKPLVACYWEFRVPPDHEPFLHTIPPDGGVSFSCNIKHPTMLINGPSLVPLQPMLQGGDQFWGVRLWPGTSCTLFPNCPMELVNRVGPASEIVSALWLDKLAQRLSKCRDQECAQAALDSTLCKNVHSTAFDSLVMEVVFRILHARGAVSIASLVQLSGIGERQFRRRFKAAVGLNAKELARIRRLRASIIDSLESVTNPWVELACRHGYTDQSHLSHEFRKITGLAPRKLKHYFNGIAHGPYQR